MPRYDPPAPLTSLIGREHDVATVRRLLGGGPPGPRLLTLTGPGGVGKTRLALEVARSLAEGDPDGVVLAELASLTDPARVAQAVAAGLGLHEVPGHAPHEALVHALRPRRLLLVLDNCEHLLDACAALAEALLRGCSRLRILATSRQPLGVAGETAWRVPPLAVPDPHAGAGPDELGTYPAVRLFCERARAALPEFLLEGGNAAAVARICRRLDGLPLAIELAAARVRLLGPEQILERLDDRFRLLVGGSRGAPARQQTLRATLDWSYALLDEPERVLLRRLAVFAGGWALDAAEAVGADPGAPGAPRYPVVGPATEDLLEVLGRLADESLVVVEGQQSRARYRLLETVRQYALETLRDSGEAPALLRRHAAWCLALAAREGPELALPELVGWLDRLEREHDNLRAALGWARGADPELGARLAVALARFWRLRGHLAEGQDWLEALLPALPGRTALRARALGTLGELAVRRGDDAAARAAFEESLAIHTEGGDQPGRAAALRGLGLTARFRGEHERARTLFEESLALFRALGDRAGAGWTLAMRGALLRSEGDVDSARPLLEEALKLLGPRGDPQAVAYVLNCLGQLARRDGDYATARRLLEDCLARYRALGGTLSVGWMLECLSRLALLEQDLPRAERLLEEAGAILDDVGDPKLLRRGLWIAGALAVLRGEHARGARLLGAGARDPVVRDSLDPDERRDWGTCLEASRAAIGEAAFGRAWADGRAMTLEQALAYRDASPRPPAPPARPDHRPADRPAARPATTDLPAPRVEPSGPLSPREREVAALVAQGCSNREIAQRLVITEGTARIHVEHILRKLALRSRTQLAVWVLADRRAPSPAA
jgi:non-specific serine/threonine protein kinase